MNPAGLIAGQSVRLALRDRTVVLMMAMFALMVLLSAWQIGRASCRERV